MQSHPDDPHTGVSAAAQGIGAVVQHLLLRKQRIDTGSAVLRQLCSGEHHGRVNAQRLRLTGQQLFQCVVLILQCAAVQAHHLLQSQRTTGTANSCAGTAHILRRVSTCIGSEDSIRHTLCPQFHRRHMIPLQPFQNGIADGIRSGGNANAGELSGTQKGLCCFQQCCLIRRLYRCKAAPEKGDLRFFQRCAAFQHFPASLCHFRRCGSIHRSADGALVAEAALVRAAQMGNEKRQRLMLCHSP